MHTAKINEEYKDPNDILKHFSPENREDYGYYLMRTNYKRIKPHSKYTQEGARPRSPNIPYSTLRQELIDNNAKKSVDPSEPKNAKRCHYVDRYGETVSQHLIRGQARDQPYCYIRKDAYSNELPKEHTNSLHGAYPTWGPDKTGSRTIAHNFGEPVERFTNIDMYRRPLTNAPGRIVFDYGRPNSGYYLQRNHYNNTWFDSSLKLNQTTGILVSIEPKTAQAYKAADEQRLGLTRSKTIMWPYASEYVSKFTLRENKLPLLE